MLKYKLIYQIIVPFLVWIKRPFLVAQLLLNPSTHVSFPDVLVRMQHPLYFSSIFSCWDNGCGHGSRGRCSRRRWHRSRAWLLEPLLLGGARGALGAVLQARLLAQGNVMHQFGAAAPLPFFLPPPDLGLLRGTGASFAARVAPAKMAPSQARIRCASSTAARSAASCQSSVPR